MDRPSVPTKGKREAITQLDIQGLSATWRLSLE